MAALGKAALSKKDIANLLQLRAVIEECGPVLPEFPFLTEKLYIWVLCENS